MGCCLSQPENDSQENTPRTVPATVASPVVPPPQYNERSEYVVESGKSMEPIRGESSNDPVGEHHQDEKKNHSSDVQTDPSHSISAASIHQSSEIATVGATSTTKRQEEKEVNTLTSTHATTTAIAHNDNNTEINDTSNGWPIIIRSSMAGKDIILHLPGLPSTPYWTLHELRQQLEPQLQKIALASTSSSSSSTTNLTLRVRFIYLGKILSDNTTLIPLAHHSNSNTTAPSDSIILDKYGVIQAMVSKMD